jgi:light-regulated signal transduction histidine kinase (bacteriophytochrome)
MRLLIDDLLQLSRIGSTENQFVEVDLNHLTKIVLDSMHMAVDENKSAVSVGSLPAVRGDGLQLAQVLQNLISNGIKFHGPEPPRIDISAREGTKEWIISVKDSGIGIDPEYADKLFKMFSRLHTKEEYPGTGLGLAISKKIVERHGGRIWFESEPGRGTTFFFTLPK